MSLIIFAAVAGVVTWIVFLLLDKKKKPDQVQGKMKVVPEEAAILKPLPLTVKKNVIYYNEYQLSATQRITYFIIGGLLAFLIGYIFYHKILIALIFSLVGFFFPNVMRKNLITKRKQELGLQFKEALYSLSSNIAAGRSVENAFREIVSDLRLLYTDPNTYILVEFMRINHKVENGETIESALIDFSERADIEDIRNFVDVFTTCKRTGGDLVSVIRRTSNIIAEKLETEQEISVTISQKKFESKILMVAPFAFVAILTFASGAYMDPLFNTLVGIVVMTVALVILAGVYWLTQWIMDIKV